MVQVSLETDLSGQGVPAATRLVVGVRLDGAGNCSGFGQKAEFLTLRSYSLMVPLHRRIMTLRCV